MSRTGQHGQNCSQSKTGHCVFLNQFGNGGGTSARSSLWVQKRRFGSRPLTSGLPLSTDISDAVGMTQRCQDWRTTPTRSPRPARALLRGRSSSVALWRWKLSECCDKKDFTASADLPHAKSATSRNVFTSDCSNFPSMPQRSVRQVPLPCPASGCERAYAMNLSARTQGERRSLLQAWAYWRNVVSICRKHRQISMSPMQWFYI